MEPVIVISLVFGVVLTLRFLRSGRTISHGKNVGDCTQLQLIDLDAVFASSKDTPKLVFLHDPSCLFSALARRQVARSDVDVVQVDVSRQHDLTRQIALRTGIRHESPQAILLDQGVAVWHESHSGINRKSIEEAVSQVSVLRAPLATTEGS